ncbi:pentapeptide repeat-containing protein [Sulfitobacter dubius]|uniref:pentapeptide repeat-containing protein n=1 Tax=Sulfitobacter dubius TaxID=218673 RepID=UPI0029429A4A|nr:pentapeptide repeat-containing protein [Sulfitobacter dubius]WOI30455.1 pentapeptide repeat-containing protein [Sulfitobacter dubius]
MSIYFKKPGSKRNLPKVLNYISMAALEGLTLNLPNAIREIDSAIGETFEEHSPDEVAWTWMYATLATAVYSYSKPYRGSRQLSESRCREIAKELAQSILEKIEGIELSLGDLINPADSAVLFPEMADTNSALQHLFLQDGKILGASRKEFQSALRAASARVLAMDPSYYAPLHQLLDNPMSAGEQRDRAWQRHATWIRSLYERKPIFTINPEQCIPLSGVYQHLRAYWHDDNTADTKEGNSSPKRPKKRSRTHVDQLHTLLHNWLGDNNAAPLRVVAGGPGSGKSSFAKAFAVEVSDQTEWRTIFIELQNLEFDKGDLERRIGEHLTSAAVYSAIDPAGTAGFPHNPLDWRVDTSDPILLLFDGLDELSASNETAAELSRTFVLAVNNYLVKANANTGVAPIRAVILGRNTACEAGVRAANLPIETMIHVAALKPLSSYHDLGLKASRVEEADLIIDQNNVRGIDQRVEYWQRWAKLTGMATDVVPKAVNTDLLEELNVEPLLLHLLIQSGYTGDNWEKAAENRNRVYQSIFNRVLKRNEEKTRLSGRVLVANDAMIALECMGLAAWRGGGRTGENSAFRDLLERYAPRLYRIYREDNDLLSQHYIAVQFHTRQGIDNGYEFLHKSFGEYLTARALLSIAQISAKRMLDEEEPETRKEAARRWCTLIASAEMTDFIQKFILDEARLLAERIDILPIKDVLTKLFSWVQQNGMPVHEEGSGTYREIETAQRCAESALLAVISALARACRTSSDMQGDYYFDDLAPWSVEVKWPNETNFELPSNRFSMYSAPRKMLTRLGNEWEPAIRRSLAGLVLSDSWLSDLWLIDADLSRANLSHSHLILTNLARANLSAANLTSASLTDAHLAQADLTRAVLTKADLTSANLRDSELTKAKLDAAELINADLSNANLAQAKLTGANLTMADLTGANLEAADLTKADFTEADLTGANLTGANLTAAVLSRANLTDVDLTKVIGLKQTQVDSAIGNKSSTKLTPDMNTPDDWQ